jgi:hypothetical protein
MNYFFLPRERWEKTFNMGVFPVEKVITFSLKLEIK